MQRGGSMANGDKYNQILDALQKLLESKDIHSISVSEIAKTAGIGKGSIYYYFPSKDAILDALVERNYEKPLETAKQLTKQTDIPPFTRMAMLFQACRASSGELMQHRNTSSDNSAPEMAFIHQKHLTHVVTELKPALTELIQQTIDRGDFQFDHPAALAEIVLIVLAVKIDNTLIPSSPEEITNTIRGLIELLEKCGGNSTGELNYLMMF